MAVKQLRFEAGEKAAVFHFAGALDRERVAGLWPQVVGHLERTSAGSVVADCAEVGSFDSSGLALLRLLERACREQGREFSRRNVPAAMADFIRFAAERSSGQKAAMALVPEEGIARLGAWALERLHGWRAVVAYLGALLTAAGEMVRHPRQLRFQEILYHLQQAGANGLPFVLWLSGLMGFIIGMQGTASLSGFAAAIRVADVVTLGTMKEMAPLLTAVIIAGRSGAAYAAEIGTMKIREEIDALEVMGLDPLHFLVIPRVLGLALAGPLLTMLAEAAGILGGTVVGVWILGIAPLNFLQEAGHSITLTLICEGLLKGFGFSLLIGLNGCFRGLRTQQAAESVGAQTTSAVVSGIFLIILADAFFSGIFYVFSF